MLRVHREGFLILILLGLYFFSHIPQKNSSSIDYNVASWFPQKINDYTGSNVEIDEDSALYRAIPKDSLVLRRFRAGNNEINLALVLASDKKSVHDPQVCYVLQGFEFLKKSKKQITKNLVVNDIEAKKGGKEYAFIYWYTDLDEIFVSRIKFWASIITKKLTDKPIKAYGSVILYTDKENSKDLALFASKVVQIASQGYKNRAKRAIPKPKSAQVKCSKDLQKIIYGFNESSDK